MLTPILSPDLIRYIAGFNESTTVTLKNLNRVCRKWANALSLSAIQNDNGIHTYHAEDKFDYDMIGQRTRSIRCSYLYDIILDLALIADKCPYLTSLKLEYTCSIKFSISNLCRLRYLTEINFTGSSKITDKTIVAISKHLTSLTYLNISQCRLLTNASINALVDSDLRLTEVKMNNIYKITADAFYAFICKFGPYLTLLEVFENKCFTTVLMQQIIPLCPNLTHFSGNYREVLPVVYDDGYGAMIDNYDAARADDNVDDVVNNAVVADVARVVVNDVAVNVDVDGVNDADVDVDDADVDVDGVNDDGVNDDNDDGVNIDVDDYADMAQMGPGDDDVDDVDVNYNVDDYGYYVDEDLKAEEILINDNLIAIANNWPKLKHISFDYSNCFNVNVGVNELVHKCSLEVMFISNVHKMNVDTIVSIAQYSPRLNTIQLQGVVNGNIDDVLEALSRYCPLLERIVISERFKHRGWESFVRGCNRLIDVRIYDTEITDQIVEQLSLHCPKLAYLTINNCRLLTDAAFQSLSNCKKLRFIHFDKLLQITDVGIAAFVRGCTELTNIYLEDCYRITNLACELIAENCESLIYIRLCKEDKHNEHMTYTAYHSLLKKCTMLRSVSMSIINTTREQLVQLRARFPNCTIW